MSFSDPQSITINSVANSLPRVSSGVNSGDFQSNDGAIHLTISHSYGKRTRRVIRVDQKKLSSDPYVPANFKDTRLGAYLVIDQPLTGFTNTEVKYLVDGLTAYLTAASGANVTKILGGEN